LNMQASLSQHAKKKSRMFRFATPFKLQSKPRFELEPLPNVCGSKNDSLAPRPCVKDCVKDVGAKASAPSKALEYKPDLTSASSMTSQLAFSQK
jgi:hypothetical protein